MIILTGAQAIQISGQTAEGNELRPVVLSDETTFVLPEEVLNDPAHAQHHAFLASLPTREIDPEEWVQPEI